MRVCEKNMLDTINSFQSIICSCKTDSEWMALKNKKSVNKNTVVRIEEGCIIVSLYDHDIIAIGGGCSVNHCGYMTQTTKSRINAVSKNYGFSVFSEKGEWWINYKKERINEKIKFTDGWNVLCN